MGLPLSSYKMLNNFIDAKRIGDNEFIEKTQSYTLYGLIVHDPMVHIRLNNLIRDRFTQLDRHTGDNFLFFTLTDAPPRWLDRTSNRNYHDFLINDNPQPTDPQIDVYGFCQYLDIDYNELPVIILTNNLTFDGFQTVKTNYHLLEEQFEEISDFCDEVQGFFNMFTDRRFKNLIASLNNQEQNIWIKKTKSIAEGIIDLFSITETNDSVHSMSIVYEKVIQEIQLQAEKFNLDYVDEEYANEAERRIEELKLYLSTRFAQSNYINQNHILHLENGFETESFILLKTFNSVAHCLSINNQIDNSIGILPITKIFEIEINLSFVQYIRETLDIDMPAYFNKPFRNRGNFKFYPDEKIVGNNPKPIDFNQIKNNKFIPPGIGQTEVAVRTLSLDDNLPSEFLNSQFSDFMHQWKILRELRNLAAHTGSLRKQDFNRALQAFQWMESNGFNRKIIELKNELKG